MTRRVLAACLAVALLLLGPGAAAWAATEEAVLAGGCFWCLEHDLEDLPGVIDAESGYSGGHLENPAARQRVSDGYRRLRELLGEPGVTRRAASAILDALPETPAS